MIEKRITNSKVLVTGGAGFIGSNLCEDLLKYNNKVTCLDNFSTGNPRNIEDFLKDPNFTLVEGDIRNYSDCTKAADGVEYVLHQAALGSVPRSIKDPMTTTDVNVGGFVKMLFAAKEAGVKRFVYAASSSVYGNHPVLPKVEDQIGDPLSPYAISKLANEVYAKNFSEIYRIETIGLRYFNVFGRRQDPNGAYAAVIPRFVLKLMNHESPVINGDGSYSRDFTYINNVIHANHLAVVTPTERIIGRQKKYLSEKKSFAQGETEENVLSEVFNVACGERTNLNELAKILKQNLSDFDPEIANVEILHGPNRAGDVPHSLASIEKGKYLLGYESEFSVMEGLKESIKWYWKYLK